LATSVQRGIMVCIAAATFLPNPAAEHRCAFAGASVRAGNDPTGLVPGGEDRESGEGRISTLSSSPTPQGRGGLPPDLGSSQGVPLKFRYKVLRPPRACPISAQIRFVVCSWEHILSGIASYDATTNTCLCVLFERLCGLAPWVNKIETDGRLSLAFLPQSYSPVTQGHGGLHLISEFQEEPSRD